MSADSHDITEPQKKLGPINKFGFQGVLLFFDQLLVAVSGWIYWLIIVSKITSFEVGKATEVYSLVLFISALTQLGLEFPLLKRSSSNERYQILGTIFVIELAITLSAVPIVYFVLNDILQARINEMFEFTWLAVGILVLSSLGFVSRFALLGVSDVKSVLITDLTATIIKFATGYVLVSMGASRKVISIGSIEILAFLVFFFFLVPHYETRGAAFSILIAFVSSSALSLIWLERTLTRYITISVIGIIAGVVAGYIIESITHIHPLGVSLTSFSAALVTVFALKNISPKEIEYVAKRTINRT